MNVVVLNTALPSTAWRRAFAEALIRLRPDLNPDAVDELSDSAYLRYAHVFPGEAALLYQRDGNDLAAALNQAARWSWNS